MRALHTTLALETGRASTPMAFVKTRRPAPARAGSAATRAMLRNMALFLLAPFVGLLYAVLLPFVGLAMLAVFATRALVESGKLHAALRIGKKVLVIAAAPLAGLAYLVALPFIGLGMLVWFGTTGMRAAPAK